MQSELEIKIEMAGRLFRYCQATRCSKREPQLAAEAARREMGFQRELEGLQLEKSRLETPEEAEVAPCGHHHHDKAA